MDVEENIPNTQPVLCMECWHHISNFNNFQQMILLVQEKLQDVERAKSAEPAEESIDDIIYLPPKEESHSQLEENVSVVGGGVHNAVRQPTKSFVDPGADIDIKIEHSSLFPSAASRTCQLIPTDSAKIPKEANMEDIKYVPPKVKHEKLSDITEGTETKFDKVLVNSNCSDYDLKESKNILIKQEEPLEIVDIYVADEMEDDDDNDDALHNGGDGDDDESLSQPGAINAPINSDNSNEPKEYSSEPTNKKRRKKTANELDAVIAQWMPTLNCDVCPESFPTFTRLHNHVREMHNKTKLSVPCCGRVFKSRPSLEEHAQLHLNPQAFECVICTKACLSIHCLKRHMVHVHSTGLGREAVHKCNICGKSFRVPSALRRHVVTHAKKRSHNCFFCEKSFTYRTGLYYHIKSAHPGKQMPKYTTERPFTKCAHCSKEFVFRKCLSRHVRTQHPDMI